MIKRVKHQAYLSFLQRAITSYLKSSQALVDNTAFFASRAAQTASALRATNLCAHQRSHLVGSVEIYCELCLPLYSMAVINLDCSLVFFFKSFFYVLLAAKRTKSPGTRKVQSASSLFRNCSAISFSRKVFAT